MTEKNAKWELQIILTSKLEIEKMGRSFDYSENKRIDKLREFLDSIGETEKTVAEDIKPDALDVPF